jgi:hypothetical protein
VEIAEIRRAFNGPLKCLTDGLSPGVPYNVTCIKRMDTNRPAAKNSPCMGRRMLLLTFFDATTSDGPGPCRELKEALNEQGGQHE